MKYSNVLTSALLNPKPILLFSTCGHKIHEECLTQSLEQDQYAARYPCLLCKSTSNIRLPLLSRIKEPEAAKFFEEFMVIDQLEVEERPLVENATPRTNP